MLTERDEMAIGGYLQKACEDPCSYALGLMSGEVFDFHWAHDDHDGWISLRGGNLGADDGVLYYPPGRYITNDFGTPTSPQGIYLDRGVDVRKDQIAWVADYPGGS